MFQNNIIQSNLIQQINIILLVETNSIIKYSLSYFTSQSKLALINSTTLQQSLPILNKHLFNHPIPQHHQHQQTSILKIISYNQCLNKNKPKFQNIFHTSLHQCRQLEVLHYLHKLYLQQQSITHFINIQHMNSDNLGTPNRTIYLGGLPFEGSPVDFKETHKIVKDSFKNKNIEDVEDVKVKDKKSNDGTNYFYAFVTFKTPEAAEKALEAKVIKIEGKDIVVQRYTQEKDYQLYIKDVGTLEEKHLNEFFSKAGKLGSIQLYKDHGITTALVKFQNPEHAEQFLKKPDQIINGVNVKVDKYIPKQDRRQQNHRQLYLKKIPLIKQKAKLQEELLKQFEKYGQVTKKIDIQLREGFKVGSAIICYANPKNLEEARVNFNTKLFGGATPMELDFYLTKRDRQHMGTIFLGNVKSDTDIQTLLKLFGTFGKIEAYSFNKVVSKSNQGLTQKGTITFETKQSMIEALSEWNKLPDIYSFFISGKQIVTLFQDKTERSDFLRTQKLMKPNQPQFQMGLQGAMRTPFGMPQMGSMMMPPLGSMGMNPMGFNQMGMNPMGMGNPYFAPINNPPSTFAGNIPNKMNVNPTK